MFPMENLAYNGLRHPPTQSQAITYVNATEPH